MSENGSFCPGDEMSAITELNRRCKDEISYSESTFG